MTWKANRKWLPVHGQVKGLLGMRLRGAMVQPLMRGPVWGGERQRGFPATFLAPRIHPALLDDSQPYDTHLPGFPQLHRVSCLPHTPHATTLIMVLLL